MAYGRNRGPVRRSMGYGQGMDSRGGDRTGLLDRYSRHPRFNGNTGGGIRGMYSNMQNRYGQPNRGGGIGGLFSSLRGSGRGNAPNQYPSQPIPRPNPMPPSPMRGQNIGRMPNNRPIINRGPDPTFLRSTRPRRGGEPRPERHPGGPGGYHVRY